ncbi:hypothetical protein [Mucilaginibacter sp. 22184]|uniref:hypothetical protein n=1 Tax=Mucilaginibacter sp. 22184 TaxID=3453887 RepID=UPI003F87CC37
MKPINIIDLNRSYRVFIMYLAGLLMFAVVTVYFFFLTSSHEMVLLNAKVKQTDQLVAIRNDINNSFEVILMRMQQLSQYSRMNSEELNNQNTLLNDIQENNQHILDKLQSNPYPLKSFDLYKKLSNHIATIANVKDSLFTTRFQIESLRSQLESCNKINKAAASKLSGRFSHY